MLGAWLCVAVCGCVWLCVAVCGCVCVYVYVYVYVYMYIDSHLKTLAMDACDFE